MTFPTRYTARYGFVAASLLALASCGDGNGLNDLDFDMRGLAGGFTTADAARDARTAARPTPDAQGVISYPTYDVAVAREGETIAQMASRLGLGPNELGRYNGIPPETALRGGEIIALPRKVGGAGTPGTATAGGTIDVTTLAGNALDRVGTGAAPASTAAAGGSEPVRHQVSRGETAYSIARNYGVSVRALAEWNSLDSALSVREGQYLLIPVVMDGQSGGFATEAPGTGSLTPVPPSAGTPLPDEDTTTAAATVAPASPGLGSDRTAASGARMAMPVDGSIARAFEKGKTDGIDISASAGAPVRAAAAGTVAAITRDTDQVPILVIRHSGNLLTVYAGIDNIKVEKGDSVSQGQTIANVRAASPSFLHFQVREGTLSVDPLSYLN
jgi:LysM repeat protein